MGQGVDTKEKILQTALSAFSRHGYEGARMEKIATEIGINKASLYFHFSGKEEIFRVLFRRVVEKYEVELERIFSNTENLPIKERLLQICRDYLTYHYQNPEMDFWNLVYYLPPELMKSEILEATNKSKNDLIKGLSEILAQGIHSKVIQELPLEPMAMSLYYLLTCISLSTEILDQKTYLSGMASCFEIYWNGIKADLVD
ncbi:MAG TPA: TetR/AcrR family transcriptional regulator [Clostridiaceae bacterium]|nr:TetR/AcrR family transcriptional regulator [Clostridiaceae bacterium]